MKRRSALLFSSLPFLIEGVNGLGATPVLKGRQDITPTFDTSLPTSSPLLLLHNLPASLSTCNTIDVTWAYAGPLDLQLNLVVTNIGVIAPISSAPSNTFTDGDVFAVPSGASQPQPTQVVIAQAASPQASSAAWNINVPSGWYQIFAQIGSTYEDSTESFFVQTGDTSCLSGVSTTSTGTSSLSTSGSVGSTSSPVPGPASPVNTTQKNSQIGVIVGVVAGAVVFLIIVLMAYLWLRRRKNALDRPIGGQSGGAKLNRGWGGLGSVSSVHGVSGRGDRRSRASRDLTPATRSAGHHLATGNSIGTNLAEDVAPSGNSTPFSPSMEKFGSSPAPYTNPFDDAEGGLALATLPSTNGIPLSSSRTSLQQAGLPSPHLSSSADSFMYSSEPRISNIRTSSIDVHLHSSLSSSPPPEIEMARSYSASSSARAPSTDLSHQQQKKINRQSTGSQSYATRKTPRKPVPVYEPSVAASSNLTPESLSPSASYAPSPVTPTTVSTPFGSSAHGHYAKKSQPDSEGNTLSHKSSFGPGGVEGKPLHYLIPDMPLPTKS